MVLTICGRLNDAAFEDSSRFSWGELRDLCVRVTGDSGRLLGMAEGPFRQGRFTVEVCASTGGAILEVFKARRPHAGLVEVPLLSPISLQLGSADLDLGTLAACVGPDVIAPIDPTLPFWTLDDFPRDGLQRPGVSAAWDQEFLGRVVPPFEQRWLASFTPDAALPRDLGRLLSRSQMANYQDHFDQRVMKLNPRRMRPLEFTDDLVAEALLDGFHPVALEKVEGGLRARFDWSHIDPAHIKPGYALGPSEALLSEDGERLLSIGVGGFTYRPGDDRWHAARREFMSHYVLDGELDTHFGRGHVLVEAYALNMLRHLRRSPLLTLLWPHLNEVTRINRYGRILVTGEGGIFERAGPMTWDGVASHLAHHLRRQSWRDWAPPRPMTPSHRYPRALALFSGLLREHIERFFVRHADGLDAFSDEHDAFCAGLAAACPWMAPSSPSRLDELKDIAHHAIVHATFVHTWSNDRQYRYGGNVLEAPFSVSLTGEAPELGARVFQAFIASTLSVTASGMLFELEGDDLDPFIDALDEHFDAFEALGMNVEFLRAGVNT
jgi:hypothetical protein